MGDWSKPALTDSYADFLACLNARLIDCARLFDPALTPANLPAGAIRWNPTDRRFEKWSGTAWAQLEAGNWDMSVTELDGFAASDFLLRAGGTITGTLGFGARLGQFLNLYGTTFGFGVQANTMYARVPSGMRFAIHSGGAHSDAAADPGAGGVCLLDATSGLWKFYVGATVAANASVYLEKRQSWDGLNYDPVLRGSSADEWTTIHAPRVPYLDSNAKGTGAKTANTSGSFTRLAANVSASAVWDAGILKHVGDDLYSICRNAAALLRLTSAGALSVPGSLASNLLGKSQIVVDAAGGAGATYNTVFGYDGALFLTQNCFFDGSWKCAGRGATPGTCSYVKVAPDGSATMASASGQTAGAAVSGWTVKGLWDAAGNWIGGGGGVITKEYVSPQQTITLGGLLTLAHGLGEEPKLVQGELVCVANSEGYVAGEKLVLSLGGAEGMPNAIFSVRKTNSQLLIRIPAGTIPLPSPTSGVSGGGTWSNFRLVFRAYA